MASKNGRLFRRSFLMKSIGILFLLLFLAVSGTMEVNADGKLDLNTSIITNDEIKVGNTSDFKIRGELFSAEIEEKLQKSEELLKQHLQVVDKLDFSRQAAASMEKIKVPDSLFLDYNPQVITLHTGETADQSKWLAPVVVLTGVFVVFAGALLGRMWARRRGKKHD